MMEHNGLDLIYILDTPRWDQNWVKVMEKAEPVVFVASADSEFAGKTLKMEDILEEPFSHRKNANYRQALDQQLALKKQALSPVLEISDTAFIIRMLEKNHGLSFLPYLAVERDIRKEELLFYMWKMWRYPCTGRSFTIKISLRQERWRSLSVWRQSESQSL